MSLPHKCPVVIAKNSKSEKAYYIRKANCTIRANAEEERILFEYAGKVPFDKRPNMRASPRAMRGFTCAAGTAPVRG